MRAIQELASHANLTTTMGYMHLSPAAVESAIRQLEDDQVRGDILETPKRRDSKWLHLQYVRPWRRRESNPRPEEFHPAHLRAYLTV